MRPKQAYGFLQSGPSGSMMCRMDWSRVWKLKIAPRIKVFLWKFLHDALPFLVRRNVMDFSRCVSCGDPDDSCVHIIFYCSVASDIWDRFTHHFALPMRGTFDPHSWFLENLGRTSGSDMVACMAIIMWLLWSRRNLLLHEQEFQSATTIWARGLAMIDEFRLKRSESEGVVEVNTSRCDSCIYSPFLINTDASFIEDIVPPGVGWICRLPGGELVRAEGSPTPAQSALAAEAIAILVALQEDDWRRVRIQSDSSVIIQSLSSTSFDAPWRILDILESIKAVVVLLDDVVFVYVHRDCNAAADWIAGLARRRGSFSVLPESVPWQLGELLNPFVVME